MYSLRMTFSSSWFWARNGTANCQGWLFSGFAISANVGIIGSSISQVMWLCASFMLLADAARYVSSDVPMNSIGTRISSILPMARNDTFNCRPSVPANCALNLKASRVSSSVARPIMQAAAILPLTTALRGAGVASSGSSDWRSRSPAVASRIR